jgi:hypothetical protein
MPWHHALATLGTKPLPNGSLAGRGDRGIHREQPLGEGVRLEEVEQQLCNLSCAVGHGGVRAVAGREVRLGPHQPGLGMICNFGAHNRVNP